MPNYLTLTEYAQQTHNNELVAMVQEVEKSTTLLNHFKWKASTDALRDISGVAGEPLPATWVGLDKGVKPTKGMWSQREEHIGLIESWSVVNEKTQMLAPNADMLRWENDQLHIQGLGLDVEKGILYGNPDSDPNQPLGFMPRFNKITNYKGIANNKQYDYVCLDAGGTGGNLSSILLIASGAFTPTLLYPRYQKNNGLLYRHFDYENSVDEEGGFVRVAKSQFQMAVGLSIRNRKTAVRIANVDPTALGANGSMSKIADCLYEAFAAIPQLYKGSVSVWTNSAVTLGLRKYYQNRVTNIGTYAETGVHNLKGELFFDNFKVNVCDSMLDTEDAVA